MAKNNRTAAILTVSLTIEDRFTLLQLLPNEGNIATLRVVHELRQRLAPSEQESARAEVRNTITPQGGVTVTWNQKKDFEKKVPFYGIGLTLVVDRLKKLDTEQKLELHHLSLWNKFVEPAPQAPPA